MYILHADEMNKLDEYAIGHIGIMQCVLMERAALGVADCILKQFDKPSVLVLSGPGNCGGDGLALARILLDRGLNVRAYLPLPLDKCKESVQNEAKLFEGFGGEILYELPDEGEDIIVDAVFGVGLNRPVTGAFLDAIKWMNSQKEKSNAHIFSVDIPSGIHTDTGAIMGDAVKADDTVTFSYLKPGLLLYPGREYAGEITVSSIGIDSVETPGITKNTFTYDVKGIHKPELKIRKADGNKGTFHRILVIAGSRDMAGAAILCSESALRSGAGLVELYTHEKNRQAVLSAVPEAILHTYEDEESDIDAEMMNRSDAVIIGPGLSKSDYAKELVKFVLMEYKKPLVLDADGINIISEDDTLKAALAGRKEEGLITVLTPHPAELSRLSGISVKDLLADYESHVKAIAGEYGVILVGKGSTSLVSDGEKVYFNLSGNDGMATAGSGDVLAGMIGAFLLNEEAPFEGVCIAVYAHGKAGDAAATENGHRGMIAGDIIQGIKKLETD